MGWRVAASSKKTTQKQTITTSSRKTTRQTPSTDQQAIVRETASGLQRQWQLLSRLTTHRWIGTRELQAQLALEGIDISLRTIQRDLNQLAERFPIESNHEVPQGWRWQQDAPVQSLPHMNSTQAVTFMMVEEHLRHLLPPGLISEMRPWFDLARRSLSQDYLTLGNWPNRVRMIPPSQPLIPPPVNTQAQQAIYEALLRDQQIEAVYHRRGQHGDEASTYILNPLSLVQRGPIMYLVCTRHDRSDIRTFVLHRFVSASVLESAAIRPADFDLDQYLASGALDFAVRHQSLEPVKIELVIQGQAIYHLMECRLSEDQTVERLDEQRIRLRATVPFTAQLVWWLRGFGGNLEQVEPPTLRDAVYSQGDVLA